MKAILTIILIASSLSVFADAPRKDPLTKYRQLWDNSLVTEEPPPVVVDPEDEVTPLDDYVLGGWTQTTQGYLVALINTKDPKDRQTIAPGMPNQLGAEVVDVERNPSDFRETKVLVKAGSAQKWIGYEDKFLTIQQPPAAANAQKAAAAQRAAQGRQRQQKPPIPGMNNNSQKKPTERKPRVRRVPVPPKK